MRAIAARRKKCESPCPRASARSASRGPGSTAASTSGPRVSAANGSGSNHQSSRSITATRRSASTNRVGRGWSTDRWASRTHTPAQHTRTTPDGKKGGRSARTGGPCTQAAVLAGRRKRSSPPCNRRVGDAADPFALVRATRPQERFTDRCGGHVRPPDVRAGKLRDAPAAHRERGRCVGDRARSDATIDRLSHRPLV